MDPIIIVGTGLAGYSLAREFRKLDEEQPLLLITADDGRSYSKPMLSNALASGKDAYSLALADADRMAQQLDATILTHTRVESIDSKNHSLVANGKIYRYRDLVLANGASPIRLPFEGSGAADVLSVNNLEDYGRFRIQLETDSPVAIIGPGLIGCEFANDLTGAGHPVHVIGPDPYPISTLLPEAAGKALQQGLEQAGIRFHLGQVAKRIDRSENGFRLTLDSGESIEAALVLSAIGLRPDTRLAEAAGIDCNRGIRVDRLLRSSDPHIFALGDVAEVEGLNLPFVAPLMTGARALARTLAGEPTAVSYPAMPVVIKTPAHPVVVAPPAPGSEGNWQVETSPDGVTARFMGSERMLGFALTGEAVAQKQAMTKELPPLLT